MTIVLPRQLAALHFACARGFFIGILLSSTTVNGQEGYVGFTFELDFQEEPLSDAILQMVFDEKYTIVGKLDIPVSGEIRAYSYTDALHQFEDYSGALIHRKSNGDLIIYSDGAEDIVDGTEIEYRYTCRFLPGSSLKDKVQSTTADNLTWVDLPNEYEALLKGSLPTIRAAREMLGIADIPYKQEVPIHHRTMSFLLDELRKKEEFIPEQIAFFVLNDKLIEVVGRREDVERFKKLIETIDVSEPKEDTPTAGPRASTIVLAIGAVLTSGILMIIVIAIRQMRSRSGGSITTRETERDGTESTQLDSGQNQERSFDVFLSHNNQDKAIIRQLAEVLKSRGLNVWLDELELRPGLSWQDALEDVIATCRSAAVCVSSDGLGPWEDPEMQALLRRFVDEKKTGNILPIIPVLLPGAPDDVQLPLFLEAFTWVDLRSGFTNKALDNLEWGVTGEKPSHD